MKLMIFHPTLDGFVIEWVHHLCTHKPSDVELYICMPKGYENVINQCSTDNINYVVIPQSDAEYINTGNNLFCSCKRARFVSRMAKQYEIDEILILVYLSVLPFVLYFLPSKTNISGIVHSIYLYKWNKMNLNEKLFNIITYKLLAVCKKSKSVFMLNDECSACYLNRKFKSQKFKLLPDPFKNSPTYRTNLREKLGIEAHEKIYLHFGGLTYRKGTYKILEAINCLAPEESKGKCFIFAGRISMVLKEKFYSFYNQLKERHHIILIDEFCEEEFLHDLCYSSDFILMPYDYTSVSSGVIGFAAFYGKPVIGPAAGLQGKLIRRYRLGMRLQHNNVAELKDAISRISRQHVKSDYVERMKIDNFTKVIYSNFFSEQTLI